MKRFAAYRFALCDYTIAHHFEFMSSAATPTSRNNASTVARTPRSTMAFLSICAGLYAALYAFFWPHINTTIDESSYLGFAYVLRHGTLYADVIHAPALLAMSVHGHLVSKYPLGMSALLAVASLGGWTLALGINLFLHLATYAVVARLLHRVGASPLFALLYLLHPTAVLYSRTVMSDLASGLLLALAFDQYLSHRHVAAGALIGASLLMRTGNIIALPVFALGALVESLPATSVTAARTKRLLPIATSLRLVLGSLPFLIASGYYAVVIAGGQMSRNTGVFGLSYFPQYFPGYVLALLVIYPGMFLAPLFYRGPGRWSLAGLCYGFVLLYSFWFYRDSGSNLAESLIIGQRYFLAALPLFIVSYGAVLSGWLEKVLPATTPSWQSARRLLLATTLALPLFALSFVVTRQHQRHLKAMIATENELLAATTPKDMIFCNVQVGKLLPIWSDRHFIVPSGDAVTDTAAVRQWLSQHPLGAGQGRAVLAKLMRPGRADDKPDGARIVALQHAFLSMPAQDAVRRYIVGLGNPICHWRSGWQCSCCPVTPERTH